MSGGKLMFNNKPKYNKENIVKKEEVKTDDKPNRLPTPTPVVKEKKEIEKDERRYSGWF